MYIYDVTVNPTRGFERDRIPNGDRTARAGARGHCSRVALSLSGVGDGEDQGRSSLLRPAPLSSA